MANGCKVTTASRKMIVSPASRMLSAISFGVFWRSAPSTNAIMRSRNVSPGLDVIFTLIWSDSTRVPPVTAERSPPDSRMTGADSPVIADSSTDAAPSMISPSDGITSLASQTTTSPTVRSAAATRCSAPPEIRRASVWVRVRRSASACALPRPSAMPSAKLANSTVNARNTVTSQENTLGCAIASTSVTTVPTSTTNMTGFLIWTRGSSLRTASTAAWRRISRSNSPRRLTTPRGPPPPPGVPRPGSSTPTSDITNSLSLYASTSDHGSSEEPLADLFDQRAESESREERQRAHDEHDGGQQADEHRLVGPEGAEPGRDRLLDRHASGQRQHRDDDPESAQQQPDRAGDVVERRVRAQPA